MVYLETVEAGGATSFPVTGNRIPVMKGSAAFWFNLRPSGIGDRYMSITSCKGDIDIFLFRLTHHGGCPVLVGSKWITNKWVGYFEQWHRFPCSTKGHMERHKPFTKFY